jgi:hypothetical protein
MLLTIRARAARAIVWVLAVATVIVGIGLVSSVRVTVWTSEGEGVYSGTDVDVSGVGTGLLCVGLLMLAAGLFLEAYGPDRHATAEQSGVSDSASTPAA